MRTWTLASLNQTRQTGRETEKKKTRDDNTRPRTDNQADSQGRWTDKQIARDVIAIPCTSGGRADK